MERPHPPTFDDLLRDSSGTTGTLGLAQSSAGGGGRGTWIQHALFWLCLNLICLLFSLLISLEEVWVTVGDQFLLFSFDVGMRSANFLMVLVNFILKESIKN